MQPLLAQFVANVRSRRNEVTHRTGALDIDPNR